MNKDYILTPFNEGQELNYMECLSNTRKYIDQRAMEIVTGLSKVLTAGTITCQVECLATNEKWIVTPPEEKKQTGINLTISKKSFFDWRFSDEEDRRYMYTWLKNNILTKNKAISLKDLYDDCGYIPSYIIENPESIPENRRTRQDDYFEFHPNETDIVTWI